MDDGQAQSKEAAEQLRGEDDGLSLAGQPHDAGGPDFYHCGGIGLVVAL
jgi:hypothetical protein